MMSVNWKRLSRKIHYWGSIVVALPIIVVIGAGLLLLLKKDIDWIQPPTLSGQADIPVLSMDEILEISMAVPEAIIEGWDDIDRIEIRPARGIIKIRGRNRWEVQLDHQTGKVLHVAYRRSDLIESIHDGTFFHKNAKHWVVLPASIILLILWISGIYLFLLPLLAKRKTRKNDRKKGV